MANSSLSLSLSVCVCVYECVCVCIQAIALMANEQVALDVLILHALLQKVKLPANLSHLARDFVNLRLQLGVGPGVARPEVLLESHFCFYKE